MPALKYPHPDSIQTSPSVKGHTNLNYYKRSEAVKVFTKNRAQGKDKLYHCELCDYMIREKEKIAFDERLDEITRARIMGEIKNILDASRTKIREFHISHHIIYLSDGGPDAIYNTICLCPNCHNRIHNDNDFINKYYEVMLDILRNNLECYSPNYLEHFYSLFNKNELKK